MEFESLNCPIIAPGRVKLPVSSDGPSGPPTPPLQPKGQSGEAPINYISLQYNWDQIPQPATRLWFNAYTRLIHDTIKANAYAFSIDDAASVMNIRASGLILTIGGPNGLENTSQFPPPLSDWFQWYMFNIGLGAGEPGWKSYSFCGAPEQLFQNKYTAAQPPGFGLNPAHLKFPCTIVLTSNPPSNKQYRFTIQKAGVRRRQFGRHGSTNRVLTRPLFRVPIPATIGVSSSMKSQSGYRQPASQTDLYAQYSRSDLRHVSSLPGATAAMAIAGSRAAAPGGLDNRRQPGSRRSWQHAGLKVPHKAAQTQ